MSMEPPRLNIPIGIPHRLGVDIGYAVSADITRASVSAHFDDLMISDGEVSGRRASFLFRCNAQTPIGTEWVVPVVMELNNGEVDVRDIVVRAWDEPQ